MPASQHRVLNSIQAGATPCPAGMPALAALGSDEQKSATTGYLLLMEIQAVQSKSLLDLMHAAKKVARAQHAVLITGESGTGKELVARAIHQYSLRAAQPWIDINCAAIPAHLLESELFGYEKGAFSGADSGKPGMFELANGGTLFLDEIGELELQLQAKLLRALDGAPFFRLGGTRKNTVDARIVAATNNNLKERVSAGKFREDLYHRLNQIQLRVPALRERREDIEALAKYFLGQQDPALRFSADAMKLLCAYAWPGNVRELRNAVTMASIFVEGPEIQRFDLPPELSDTEVSGAVPAANSLCIDDMEQALVRKALERTRGRQDRAAALLGISTRTLIRKLKLYAAQEVTAGIAE